MGSPPVEFRRPACGPRRFSDDEKTRHRTAFHGHQVDIAKTSQPELREGTILKLLRCPALRAPKPKLGSHTGEVRGRASQKSWRGFASEWEGFAPTTPSRSEEARRPSPPRREGGAIGGLPLPPPKRHETN
ncbi:dTDP-glucose 4,6-dehydratase [Trypanosoma cruzi]|nr:dTDP-glucose 4,6-dehydratase [Trypanosoma cruzi]